MGHMIDGTYHLGDPEEAAQSSGEWQRSQSPVRHWITPDGSPGPSGAAGFTPDSGRYHLFVAWNCPWAHRTLLARAMLGLRDSISVSIARPNRTDQGWVFDDTGPFSDALYGLGAMHEIYAKDTAPYTGRLTVPVLWDTAQARMVSNESSEIVRMFNHAFAHTGPDLYPSALAAQIDDWNQLIYTSVNNGVYRAGFASTQSAYEAAAHDLFAALDKINSHLANNRYLCGDQFTEADLRLFPTLARFDVAYHYAFRCNLHKLTDYPHLWAYARDIFQMPDVAETVTFDIYKQGYFSASEKRNPLGIVPIGPAVPDWTAPHHRGT
jgi:putative glutathione S-transferase